MPKYLDGIKPAPKTRAEAFELWFNNAMIPITNFRTDRRRIKVKYE